MNKNTIQLVVLNLTYEDLVQFSKVCKLAHQACELDNLWYCEALRVFIGPLEFFGFGSPSRSNKNLKPVSYGTWKRYFAEAMKVYKSWTLLEPGRMFGSEDLAFIRDEVA
jgi:hypothetical protein